MQKLTYYDVFNSNLFHNFEYTLAYEMPIIEPCKLELSTEDSLITFSKAISLFKKNHNCLSEKIICFYEHDTFFERLWNNPYKYLHILNSAKGIISPDFSMYVNMPLPMQAWNCFRNRSLAAWMQNNEIKVIPNVRWSDRRSYDFVFDGLPHSSIVSVGTIGNMRDRSSRSIFIQGFYEMLDRLSPSQIVVYGSMPKSIGQEQNIICFDSNTYTSR